MQIGDLPRARTARTAGSGRAVFGVLFVALAIAAGLFFALRLTQPSPQLAQPAPREEKSSLRVAAAAPRPPQAGTNLPQPDSPLPPVAPLKVAGADPAQSYAVAVPSDAPARHSSEAALPSAPAHTGSSSVPPTGAADATPMPTPDMAQAAVGLPPPAASARSDVTTDLEEAVGSIAATAPEPADRLVDLNTGSFEDLNTLEGGGPIGRAIIKGRPYASTEELVTKKVLRRSVYEQIKDRVTVR